ncbi:MAG TPA: glycosyltransferase family 4 protein [Gallicola sp.]|nr:glycosyltransferase family 4 protein [Gallicola sp.]
MMISVILPYANPHNLDWILKIPNVEINIGCINSTQKYRPGYFHEYDNLDNVFYLFKGRSHKDKFIEKLKRSSVLISLGIFNTELLSISKYCNKNIRLIILSEPFNPINSKKKYVLRKLWSKVIRLHYNDIHFFCIGVKDVKNYYMSLGFVKAKYLNFGFFPDLEFKQPNIKNNSEIINIGFIGQLIPRKGIDRLIELMYYITNNSYPYRVLIAGDGECKKILLKTIKDLDNPNIKYLGLISNKFELSLLYESIDILFVPSYFDGWGVIVNEGIAKSCAIVSSYNYPQILDNNNN